MRVQNLGSTVEFDEITWNKGGFAERRPNELWERLPDSLKAIAIEEIERGNNARSILENKDRNIVVLSFRDAPTVERQNNHVVRIHTVHQYGNYCYDGTKVTYEDVQTGCFLAFDDPNFDESSC